uniref:NADH-ubiquinone oxidoreductase chain 4 n=1 Tax=Metacrangonyx sp. 4 MDMBR-2012 TaxID=1200663 RepID=K7ZVX7_9CRUS|nr:NADH dehydrogenase subunit 4 [Metacrangonyx sp. 4 MDMBR-2012]
MLSMLIMFLSSTMLTHKIVELLLVLALSMFLFVLLSWDMSHTGVAHYLNIDFFSYNLLLLSIWVIILSMMVGLSEIFWKNINYFYLFNIFLLIFLSLSFCLKDYLLFYIFFESSLIPVLLIILGWGYQPERMMAGVYMLFYTLFASLPLLGLIFYYTNSVGASTMNTYISLSISSSWAEVILILAFLVKLPMYMLHVWLPKAHVEAPVSGSMILAGILLKLGGYGIIRVLPILVKLNQFSVKYFFVGVSLTGGMLVGLLCLRQMDMKMLIAYSSVCHMASCIGALLIMGELGFKGALFMMVAHGLCSSGLFYLVDVVYKRTSTRSLFVNKGLLNMMPNMSFWWFMLLAANLAAPPSLNLFSEICMLVNLVYWSKLNMIILTMTIFLTGAYNIYLYSLSQHNNYLLSSNVIMNCSFLNYYILLNHLLPLNIIIMSVMSFYCFYSL